MKLSELKYKDYFVLPDSEKEKINNIISFAKLQPVNIFEVKDILKWKFKTVKNLLSEYHSFNDFDFIKFVSRITKISLEEIANYGIIDIIKFRLFIESQIDTIKEIEKKLEHQPTGIEVAAGLYDFSDFDYYFQLRELANNDITKKIENMRYEKCYTELLARKELNEYQIRYNKFLQKQK